MCWKYHQGKWWSLQWCGDFHDNILGKDATFLTDFPSGEWSPSRDCCDYWYFEMRSCQTSNQRYYVVWARKTGSEDITTRSYHQKPGDRACASSMRTKLARDLFTCRSNTGLLPYHSFPYISPFCVCRFLTVRTECGHSGLTDLQGCFGSITGYRLYGEDPLDREETEYWFGHYW